MFLTQLRNPQPTVARFLLAKANGCAGTLRHEKLVAACPRRNTTWVFFRSLSFCRHTQVYRFVRDVRTLTGEKLIGPQLRELFSEDIACTIEDFLYTRQYWTLETCVQDDDFDGVQAFSIRAPHFSILRSHDRLLRYARSTLMLNFLLNWLHPTYWEVERAVIFHAHHGRPELLRLLLSKYQVEKPGLEMAEFEVDRGERGFIPRVSIFRYNFRNKGIVDLTDTGSVIPVSEHKSTIQRYMCLQLLRRELGKMKP